MTVTTSAGRDGVVGIAVYPGRAVPCATAGPIVLLALRRARFERLVVNGRDRCAASVRELVGAKLAPLTDELAEQVWARVKPLLARATQGACGSPTEPS